MKCDVCGNEAIGRIYNKTLCASTECREKAEKEYRPSRSPTWCRGGK